VATAPDQKSSTRDPGLPKGYDPVADAKTLPPITSSPLDTKPYTPDLTPVLVIPPPRPTTDHTQGIGGYGPGAGGGRRDVLTELSHEDELRLLADNNIDLRQTGENGLGSMRAFVVGNRLEPANQYGVHFPRVKLSTPDVNRIDRVSFSYSELESNLQRQTIAASSTGFGIPAIFRVDASYRDASAVSTHDKKVTIHFQASQVIPKAQVVFKEDDITLNPEFIAKVETACSQKASVAENLLNVLRDYGHFVPLSMFLGGRISLHTSTQLSDRSQFEAVKREFKAAADAKFSVEGVPLEAGGGVGVGTQTTTTATSSQQDMSLLMELKGGNESLATSQAGTLGTHWIPSVGPYHEWRTIGFHEHSLVPIVKFLPPTLKDRCVEILRRYFLSQLDCRRSDVLGNLLGGDKDFAQDIGGVKRITEIQVNHGENFDGLALSQEFYVEGGKTTTVQTGRIGRWRGEHTDTIKLKEDEEITSIEGGIDSDRDDGRLRQVAFVTNRRRFPDTGFYGRFRATHFKTVQVPRVRGMFGRTGAFVHGLGLSYVGLATGAKSREYLLAMEPYLFPEYDYGIIGPEYDYSLIGSIGTEVRRA
jgi:hypothetical protein